MENGLPFSGRLRLKYWRLADRYLGPRLPRSSLPYTTHLPILLTTRFLRPVRRILELGAGEHSTLAFLDRECFPELEALVSLETDPRWAERVQELAAGDARLQLQVINGLMATAAAQQNLEQYDLLFLDDSRTVPDRTQTIATVTAMRPARALVVIHDFEVLEYRYAALQFRRSFRFTGINPAVGLLWNRGRLPKSSLRSLNAHLLTVPPGSPPPDRRAWAAWLKAHVPELCATAP